MTKSFLREFAVSVHAVLSALTAEKNAFIYKIKLTSHKCMEISLSLWAKLGRKLHSFCSVRD